MNIFKNLIPNTDILLHFIAGTYILLFAKIFLPNLWALLVVVIFAISKELWDKWYKKSNAVVAEGFSTFIGGFITYWLTGITIPLF